MSIDSLLHSDLGGVIRLAKYLKLKTAPRGKHEPVGMYKKRLAILILLRIDGRV